VTPAVLEPAMALARLPLTIRGFGPVKEANADKALARRAELWAVIRSGGETRAAAE
jgi:indolepyruvate ferredoxin oxidoreductase